MTNYENKPVHRREPRDLEAAGAFSMRTMTRWQLIGVSIFGVAVLFGLLVYAQAL